MVYLELLLVGVLVWHVVYVLLHRKDMSNLLDRLMARSFEEFKYYEHKFPKDVKIATKATEKMVEKEMSVDEVEDEATKKFAAGLEEDWGPDAIDKTKIAEILDESKINRKENLRREGTD